MRGAYVWENVRPDWYDDEPMWLDEPLDDRERRSLYATCPPRRCVRCEEPSEHETWQGYLCAECFERYCETAH